MESERGGQRIRAALALHEAGATDYFVTRGLPSAPDAATGAAFGAAPAVAFVAVVEALLFAIVALLSGACAFASSTSLPKYAGISTPPMSFIMCIIGGSAPASPRKNPDVPF